MHHTPSPALPLSPPSPVQNYAEIGYQEEMCPRGMYMYCRICCLWSDGPLCFMKLLCITGASQHTVLFDFGTDYVTERLLSDGWSWRFDLHTKPPLQAPAITDRPAPLPENSLKIWRGLSREQFQGGLRCIPMSLAVSMSIIRDHWYECGSSQRFINDVHRGYLLWRSIRFQCGMYLWLVIFHSKRKHSFPLSSWIQLIF